jgi:hypothetical protein
MPTFHIQNKKRNRKKSALLFVCLCFAVYRQPQFFFVCFFFLFKNKPFAINQPVRDHIVSVFWKNVCCVFFWIIWPVFLFCVLYCCACVCYISIIMLVNTKIRYSCWWRDSIFYLFSFFFHLKFMSAERTITGDSQISVSPNTGILSCCWPCVSTSKGHQPVSLSCAFDWIFSFSRWTIEYYGTYIE